MWMLDAISCQKYILQIAQVMPVPVCYMGDFSRKTLHGSELGHESHI